jgi:thiosulfate dehydrogenase (quinone) large subunit
MTYINREGSVLSKFLFSNTKMSWFWLVVRIYLGVQWLEAGWEKIQNPVWVGGNAGGALTGFIKGAMAKTAGAHPDVSGWYSWFLGHAVLPNVSMWSNLVAYGEFLVGIGLILGAFTFLSAFFGFFMNINYLFAGTVSTNPVLLVLALGVMLSAKVSGNLGLDRWLKRYVPIL